MSSTKQTSKTRKKQETSASGHVSSSSGGAERRSAASEVSSAGSLPAPNPPPPGAVLLRRTTRVTVEEFLLPTGVRADTTSTSRSSRTLTLERINTTRSLILSAIDSSNNGQDSLGTPTITVSSDSSESDITLSALGSALPSIPEGVSTASDRVRRWNLGVSTARNSATTASDSDGPAEQAHVRIPRPVQLIVPPIPQQYPIPSPEQFIHFNTRSSNGHYYTVTIGQIVGILDNWDLVSVAVSGVSGGSQLSFNTWESAHQHYSRNYASRIVRRSVIAGSPLHVWGIEDLPEGTVIGYIAP